MRMPYKDFGQHKSQTIHSGPIGSFKFFSTKQRVSCDTNDTFFPRKSSPDLQLPAASFRGLQPIGNSVGWLPKIMAVRHTCDFSQALTQLLMLTSAISWCDSCCRTMVDDMGHTLPLNFAPQKAKKTSESIHCQYVQWALQFAPFITYQKSATFQISTFKNAQELASYYIIYSTKKTNKHTHTQIHLAITNSSKTRNSGGHTVTSPRPLNSGTPMEVDLIDWKSLRSHLHDCSERSSPVIHLFFGTDKILKRIWTMLLADFFFQKDTDTNT